MLRTLVTNIVRNKTVVVTVDNTLDHAIVTMTPVINRVAATVVTVVNPVTTMTATVITRVTEMNATVANHVTATNILAIHHVTEIVHRHPLDVDSPTATAIAATLGDARRSPSSHASYVYSIDTQADNAFTPEMAKDFPYSVLSITTFPTDEIEPQIQPDNAFTPEKAANFPYSVLPNATFPTDELKSWTPRNPKTEIAVLDHELMKHSPTGWNKPNSQRHSQTFAGIFRKVLGIFMLLALFKLAGAPNSLFVRPCMLEPFGVCHLYPNVTQPPTLWIRINPAQLRFSFSNPIKSNISLQPSPAAS